MADQFNILDQSLSEADLLASGEEVFTRRMPMSGSVLSTSQVLRLSYFTARKTETISSVRVFSGGTAAGATPTLCRVGIYTVAADGALTLIASTVNDTALFASSTTAYTRSLSASFVKQRGQRYALGILVVTGATAPTFPGIAGGVLPVTEPGMAPRISGQLAAQADLPASIAAGSVTDSQNSPYGVLVP